MAGPEVALVPEAGEAAAAPPAAATPGAAAAASRGGVPGKKIWIAALSGAVVLGGGLGGFVVAPRFLQHPPATAAPSQAGKSEARHAAGGHGEKKKGDEIPVFELENLIVNPAGSQGLHFLMASVAFGIPDPVTEEMLRANEVKLRDTVVATLGSHTIEMLSEPTARDSLKARIKRAVCEGIGVQADLEIFLPQFVIQ